MLGINHERRSALNVFLDTFNPITTIANYVRFFTTPHSNRDENAYQTHAQQNRRFLTQSEIHRQLAYFTGIIAAAGIIMVSMTIGETDRAKFNAGFIIFAIGTVLTNYQVNAAAHADDTHPCRNYENSCIYRPLP